MQICVYVYTIHKSNAFCSFWIMFSIYKIYFYYYKNILLKLDIFYMYIQIRIWLCSLFWLIQFKKFLIKSLRFTQAQFPFYYQSVVIFLMWRSFSPTAIHALLLFALLAALALSFLSTSAALLRCSRQRQRAASKGIVTLPTHSVASCSSASIDVVFRASRENCEKIVSRKGKFTESIGKQRLQEFSLWVVCLLCCVK